MKGTCTSTQGTACARQPFGNGCAAEVLPKASPPCTFRFLISADDAASSAAMRGWPMDTPDASSELTAWETGYGGGGEGRRDRILVVHVLDGLENGGHVELHLQKGCRGCRGEPRVPCAG